MPRGAALTAAERARRCRERKRHGTVPPDAAAVTASRQMFRRTVTPECVTLTDRQEAALDLLLAVVEEHGEQPGPLPDREPTAPIEAWRAKLRRNMFQGNSNPRQAVRRLMRTMIALGVVIERDGWVCVGVYGVDIAVT